MIVLALMPSSGPCSIGAHWPMAIHLGNGDGFVLIDESADREQREGLVAILTGKAGGPFGILATTISTLHTPQFVSFDLQLEGANSTVRAGNLLELEMEPIRNPVSGAEAYPGVVLPQGTLYTESTRASSKVFRINAGISFESTGKDAAWSPFQWQGP